MKGQFGPNGALYSGWETRRHNPTYDWCIIQLGTTGTLQGFDVDTSNFNGDLFEFRVSCHFVYSFLLGNEAPAASVYALHDADQKDPQHDDSRWSEILPRTDLGPDSHHLFKIESTPGANYVKIHMYPDGGIARFRAYGEVIPVHPSTQNPFDLAHVFSGGRVVRVSDQHFGVGSNLILPGRGKNMGDGWETKRSRVKGHTDWVVIQLGAPAVLLEVELDTNHFLGNFPESCEIHALRSSQDFDWASSLPEETQWALILPRTKLGAHRQHYFELENVEDQIYTHVKVTIFPDGGLKRVRLTGRKMEAEALLVETDVKQHVPTSSISPASTHQSQIATILVVPLTSEGFDPFGQVIQAYDEGSNLNGIKATLANEGTATKFHQLSPLTESYSPEVGATTGISVFRCKPLEGITDGVAVLKTLERHPFTSQAFIPMGRGDRLSDAGDKYLVVVAHNGSDDRPDMKSLRAFLATSAQGISYNKGVWHQPMTVLGKTLDFACIETQIGDGSALDCEIWDLDLNSTYILKLDL